MRHIIYPLSLIVGALGLVSCAASAPRSPEKDLWAAVDRLEEELIEADSLIDEGAHKNKAIARVPVEINERVKMWVTYFSKKDHARFARFLDRGETYRELIQDTLRKNGVPPEIYYLGLIESGFALRAKSHASAAGPWQFMAGTADRYGLKRSAYADERYDIVRSTEAAAKYLKSLHNVFQSWYLAMAAYNAGEGRILGSIMRGGSRDYWVLTERKAMPPETRDYVPKFLAALLIGRHPERYGFKPQSAAHWPLLKLAQAPSGVSLSAIAQAADISVVDLKKYNPHLLRGVTPPHGKTYGLWLNQENHTRFEQRQSAIASLKRGVSSRAVAYAATSKRKIYGKTSSKVHKVRRGEGLASIAKKYGLSPARLRRVNALKSSRIYAGQKLVITPSL